MGRFKTVAFEEGLDSRRSRAGKYKVIPSRSSLGDGMNDQPSSHALTHEPSQRVETSDLAGADLRIREKSRYP